MIRSVSDGLPIESPAARAAAGLQSCARVPSRFPGSAGPRASFGARLSQGGAIAREISAGSARVLARISGGRSARALGGIQSVLRLQRRLLHVADVLRLGTVRMVESPAQGRAEVRTRSIDPARHSISGRRGDRRANRLLPRLSSKRRPWVRWLRSRMDVAGRLARRSGLVHLDAAGVRPCRRRAIRR